MPVLPWLVCALLLLAVLLSHLLASPARDRALAARGLARARVLAELSVSLPKLPLSKPAEIEYNK